MMKSAGISPELLLRTARTLEAAPSWILFTHMKMDGDAVGSASALFEAGVLQGRRVRWIGPDPLPPSYAFLPHTDSYTVRKEHVFDGSDLYVFLDSANEQRGIRGIENRAPEAVVLNIDHHEDNTRFGTINCVDSRASSASEILWRVMTSGGWAVTPRVAESLYAGIVADTGGFMYSNTTAETHRVAAELLTLGVDPARIDTWIRQTRSVEGMHLWGAAFGRISRWGKEAEIASTWLEREDFRSTNAHSGDTEFLVNQLLLVRGVRFAVLFIEDEHDVRVSFRSKEGALPAASVARALGGGGHPRASATVLPLSLDEAKQTVETYVEKAYAEWPAVDR